MSELLMLDPHHYQSAGSFKAMVKTLENASGAGDGKAALELAYLLCPHGERVLPLPEGVQEISHEKWLELSARAFELLLQEAANGDGQAMHYIALFYQGGDPPVASDFAKFVEWTQKAVAAGYVFAANDLYAIYANPELEWHDPEKAQQMSDLLAKFAMRVVPY